MENKLESHIKHVAQSLQTSEEEIENGKLQINHIIKIVLKESATKTQIKIIKHEIICGTAKETSIVGHIDFECVFFVQNSENNNADQIQSEMVDCIESVLIDETYIQKEEIQKIPKQHPHMMKFNYRGVNFDLFVIAVDEKTVSEYKLNEQETMKPSINKYQSEIIMTSYEDGSKLTSQQQLQLIPGYCFLLRKFFAEESDFVRDVARLGKYWNNTLMLDTEMDDAFVDARSIVIELIAVASGREETTHLEAFRNFLQKIRDFKSMKLLFSNKSFYKITSTPRELRSTPPLIMSPVNPFHNYLEDKSAELLQVFSRFAENTMTRLDQAEHAIQNAACEYDLGKIFEQQPKHYYF